MDYDVVKDRQQHRVDRSSSLNPANKERRISDFPHFMDGQGHWALSEPGIRITSGPPDPWIGRWDFAYESENQALQCWFGEVTVSGSLAVDSAMWGFRRSELNRRGAGLNIKVYDPDNSPVPSVDGNKITWANLWDDADLEIRTKRNICAVDIVQHTAGPQRQYKFTLRRDPGVSEVWNDDGSISFYDSEGEVYKIRSPHAFDSNGESVYVTQTRGEDVTILGKTYSVLIVTVWDTTGRPAPFRVDPTVEISGTTDTDDTYLEKSLSNNNNGGSVISKLGGFNSTFVYYRMMHRLNNAASNIPSGTIDSCTLDVWRINDSNSRKTVAGKSYRVAPANFAWVEGSKTAAFEVGSPCWRYLAYPNPRVDWAGGFNLGCGVPTTDFDATGESFSFPSKFDGSLPNLEQFDITASWLSDWRDGIYANSGIIMILDVEAVVQTFFTNHTSEEVSAYDPPVWVIEYSAAGGPFFLNIRTVPGYNNKRHFSFGR